MMNYCASLARPEANCRPTTSERQSRIDDNDSDEQNNSTNRNCSGSTLGDLLEFTHLRLNDSQQDDGQRQLVAGSEEVKLVGFRLFPSAADKNRGQNRWFHSVDGGQLAKGRVSAEMLPVCERQQPQQQGRAQVLAEQQLEVDSEIGVGASAVLIEHDGEAAFGSRDNQFQQPHLASMQTNIGQPQGRHYEFLATSGQYPATAAYPPPAPRLVQPAEQQPFISADGIDLGQPLVQQEMILPQGGFTYGNQRCLINSTGALAMTAYPQQHLQHQQLHHQNQRDDLLSASYATNPVSMPAEQSVYTSLDTGHYQQSAFTDCSLPEAVIRLNYQQELGNRHPCDQCQHQHQTVVEVQQQQQLRVGQSEPNLISLECLGQQQQQQQELDRQNQLRQQQDSGHVSSVSCMDSFGSESALLLVNSSHQSIIGIDSDAINVDCSSQHIQSSGCAGSLASSHSASMAACNNHHLHHHHHHHHHLNNHEEPELKLCEWEGCENTFMGMAEFVRHLEERHVNQAPKEKNRYYCLWSNCKRNEQEFNARYKLLIHMRVHSGDKPYPCNHGTCEKRFSRLENLKIHVRSHTGEKPYKCSFDNCSKSFTNSSDRIKHHKTHKDPKPYSCNYASCAKRYTDPSSLRKHLRAHKRIQPDCVPMTDAYEPGATACPDLDGCSGGELQLGQVSERICTADFERNSSSLLLQSNSSDCAMAPLYDSAGGPHSFAGEHGVSCEHQFNNHRYGTNEQQQQQQQLADRYSYSWGADYAQPAERRAWPAGCARAIPTRQECCQASGSGACCDAEAGRRHQHELLGRSLPPSLSGPTNRPCFGQSAPVSLGSAANLSPEMSASRQWPNTNNTDNTDNNNCDSSSSQPSCQVRNTGSGAANSVAR